jgi:uncharacterized protein
MAPRVVRISVAPVKSFGLVHPDEVELEPGGVVGNRRFWLRDEDGRLYAGKRDGSLLRIQPVWDEETRRLVLTFPDGDVVDGIVELGEDVESNMYAWHTVRSRRVRGPWEAAISEYVGRPVEFLWADANAVDRTPRGGTVSVMSRASLERLREEAGLTDEIDGRRFRMLFEIDGVEAHEEDGWIGAQVRIGEATLEFNGDIGRCVVTSRNPDTGVPDVPTLVTLATYRREGRTESLPFGIYGAVLVPGRVRVGDIASPLSLPEWEPAAVPS